MTETNFNISRETNKNTVVLNENSSRIRDEVNIVSGKDRDLKNTHSSINSPPMRPKLNEKLRKDSTSDSENLLYQDINLLGNPNKTKGIRGASSAEEDSDSSSESGSVSTVSSHGRGRGYGTAQDTNELFGKSYDDDSASEASTKKDFNPFGSFSGNNNEDTMTTDSTETSGSRRSIPQHHRSLEEMNQEKQEYIYRIERLEKSGYKPSKKFNINSSYDEVKSEYERLKRQRDVEKSIKFQGQILMMVSSGIEFLNGKFDPFDIKLDGWSESISENIHDYDEVFEELHEKYKEKVKMAPELKLLMMVGGSAFMFHLSNTLFKSKMPGLGDILQQNPDLARNIQQAAMNTMKQNEEKTGNQDPLFSMMMNQAQSMMGPKAPARPSGPGMGPGVREMKGPSGVDDILNMVNNRQHGKKNQSEDTISSVSTNQSTEKRRVKLRNPVNVQKNSSGKFVLDMQ